MSTSDASIDGLRPETKADFDKLEKAISAKLTPYASSDHYADFVESLVRLNSETRNCPSSIMLVCET